MEKKHILYILIISVFLVSFFFEVIPVPLENIDGNLNQDKFIYGGTYFTSGLKEVSVGNYVGGITYFSLFGVLMVSNKYLNKKHDNKNKN